MLDVAAERRRVPAGAGRLPPLPGATQAHQAHALPQRRAATDVQVSSLLKSSGKFGHSDTL